MYEYELRDGYLLEVSPVRAYERADVPTARAGITDPRDIDAAADANLDCAIAEHNATVAAMRADARVVNGTRANLPTSTGTPSSDSTPAVVLPTTPPSLGADDTSTSSSWPWLLLGAAALAVIGAGAIIYANDHGNYPRARLPRYAGGNRRLR